MFHIYKFPLSICLFLCLFVCSVAAQLCDDRGPSTPNAKTWVTNGRVDAIVSTGTITYIGGGFTYVGPNTGHGVPLDATTGAPQPIYPKVNGE